MGDVKPWQWIVIVVAVIVLGASLYLTFGRGKVDMGNRVYMIDVVSGELFVADTSGRRGVVIPAKNPETGERTVLPAVRAEDGHLSVSDRYRDMAAMIIEQRETALASVIDESTWAIETDPGSAKRYQMP